MPVCRLSFACAAACTLLLGCAVGPNYKRPNVAVPNTYYAASATAEAHSLADAPWWEVFNDPVLTDLIKQALENGYDARIAAWRVEEARARYGISQSFYYPQLDYAANANRRHPNRILDAGSTERDYYNANVGLSWELDLWGRIRRLNEAAKAEYLATEEARRGVLLSLISDVATAYFQLRELDSELEIAQRTTVAFQDTFHLFSRRLEEGAASGLEPARAQASLGSVAAAVPEIEREIVARENQLNFLLGRSPQPIARPAAMPSPPPDIPAGIPAQLLQRRPDIREVEQLLISANAQVGVAQANFFPTLSLTGLFGNVSTDLDDLFSSGKSWSISGGFLGPLFQGGRLVREKQVAKAQWEQAKIRYEAAVNNALGEVSTALTDRLKFAEATKQRSLSVDSYREAVRYADTRYISGRSSYYEVLEAQQQLFPAEITLAQSQLRQLLAVVDLYRALGGGWMTEEKSGSP